MIQHSRLAPLALLISVGIAAAGCASTKPKHISGDPSTSEELTWLSDLVPAEIMMHDGSSANGFLVLVRIDSTEWFSKDRLVRHAVATSRILSISVLAPNYFGGEAAIGIVCGTPASIWIGSLAAYWDDIQITRASFPLVGGSVGSLPRTTFIP